MFLPYIVETCLSPTVMSQQRHYSILSLIDDANR